MGDPQLSAEVLDAPGPSELRATELQNLSDEELMGHLQAGNHDALGVIFLRYHREVTGIARKILRDSAEAEDAMQTVFLEVHRAAAQFDATRGSFRIWLLQWAYHRSINRHHYLEVRKLRDQTDIADAPEKFLTTDSLRTGSLTSPEMSRLANQSLAMLASPHRQTLELASFEGLSMREIAAKTGESLPNIRHRYYRALKRLREMLTRRRRPTMRETRSQALAPGEAGQFRTIDNR